jgi:hypothetical protein
MRVHTIEMADVCVRSDVVADSDGEFVWVVRVTERSPDQLLVFERRGCCGHVPKGDALDIAAYQAREIAVGLALHTAGSDSKNAAAGSRRPGLNGR